MVTEDLLRKATEAGNGAVENRPSRELSLSPTPVDRKSKPVWLALIATQPKTATWKMKPRGDDDRRSSGSVTSRIMANQSPQGENARTQQTPNKAFHIVHRRARHVSHKVAAPRQCGTIIHKSPIGLKPTPKASMPNKAIRGKQPTMALT